MRSELKIQLHIKKEKIINNTKWNFAIIPKRNKINSREVF